MQNNILIFDECCNCGACYNVCPKDAIKVNRDGLFFELSVDSSLCINCGKCISVCPLNTFHAQNSLRKAYGGWINDDDILRNSSSGGLFSAIAEYVLSNNGFVYGAVFSEDHKEVLFKSTKTVGINEIRRSKYVESQPQLVYRDIRNDLEDEKYVLFCGTPCQVAGLKRFLKRNYERLITCDFSCGGQASHHIFCEYLKSLERKFGARVSDINFRPKLYGWSIYSIKISFVNGRTYKNFALLDPYMYSFVYSHVSVRDNCYNCKFRDNHYSDFVLADFWKWDEISNLSNDERGISLIITNSEKGDAILNEIKERVHLEQMDLDKASYNCFKKPSVSDSFIRKRESFFNSFEQRNLNYAATCLGMMSGVKALAMKAYLSFKYRKYKNE